MRYFKPHSVPSVYGNTLRHQNPQMAHTNFELSVGVVKQQTKLLPQIVDSTSNFFFKYHSDDADLVRWIEAFLRDRSLRVAVNGCVSDSRRAQIGVPQGSVPGPIFFLIYVNNLPDLL